MKHLKKMVTLGLLGALLLSNMGQSLTLTTGRIQEVHAKELGSRFSILSDGTSSIEGGWDKAFMGEDPDVKFYPDAYANYWRFVLTRDEANEHMGLKITGTFPDARYMGINVYNDKTLSPIGNITDYEIIADTGSMNPFAVPSNGTYVPNQEYTIYVIPEGTENVIGENVVYYDATLERISVFLRYYLPYQDEQGGVSLPTIEAFDTTTGEDIELPTKHQPSPFRASIRSSIGNSALEKIISPLFYFNRIGDLSTYHLTGNGMFPNRDNNYLVMPITREDDEMAIIRFKAPTLTEEKEGDVRYYSLGQGDTASHNIFTLYDQELKVAEDGYVYVAVGDPIIQYFVDEDYNYMPWLADNQMVLIYRNLVTNPEFEGNIELVPEFKDDMSATGDDYIGDYAPIGKLLTVDDFILNGFDAIQ